MERSGDTSEGGEPATAAGGPSAPGEGVGDALRTAVERTLAVTADSATETRQRAQGLLDDVVRRGQVARQQVTRRGEEATTRLADAISELRTADGEELRAMGERLGALERRLAFVEARLGPQPNPGVEGESVLMNRLDQTDLG